MAVSNIAPFAAVIIAALLGSVSSFQHNVKACTCETHTATTLSVMSKPTSIVDTPLPGTTLDNLDLVKSSLANKMVNGVKTDSRATLAAQETRDAALCKGYSDLEAWLTAGGDDRSLILDSGANKYHIRPQPISEDSIFRASCTGNPPTTRGYQAASRLYKRIQTIDESALDEFLDKIFKNQRDRLTSLLNLPDGAEVVLCPSGSDAEYIPLAIAQVLSQKKIVNGVSQLKEIGAGSAPAAKGRYFSTRAPLLGQVVTGEPVLQYEDGDGVTIDARTRQGGIVNAAQEMQEFCSDALNKGYYPILHGVFGGKTGLRDASMPASLDGGDTSLGVVDACQGRFTSAELQSWLDQDSLVLFTGSKFYQAPPFCGAVIIPPTIAKKLREKSPPKHYEGLTGFITSKEVPSCLAHWKQLISPNSNNVGLALRWEAGLAGMQAIQSVSDEKQCAAVDTWAKAVTDLVSAETDCLEAWCVERSIVSIRVAAPDHGWLSMSQLRNVFRWMSMDVSSVLPTEDKNILETPCFIGQPVDVSESHAIVRIALGVESLLSYLQDPTSTLQQDERAIKKLALLGKHYETMVQSGL